jgi:hypothetical protein
MTDTTGLTAEERADLKAKAEKAEADRAADEQETYDIGHRDGYESAVQDVDLMTGGDGEYYASTIPGHGCPDPAAMKARIDERFKALTARAEKAEQQRDQARNTLRSINQQCGNVRFNIGQTLADVAHDEAMRIFGRLQTESFDAVAALSTPSEEG